MNAMLPTLIREVKAYAQSRNEVWFAPNQSAYSAPGNSELSGVCGNSKAERQPCAAPKHVICKTVLQDSGNKGG